MTDWPKRTTAFIHSDEESMRDKGKNLGLSGEPLSLFRHALMEVTVEIDVNEDGTYKIVSFEE